MRQTTPSSTPDHAPSGPHPPRKVALVLREMSGYVREVVDGAIGFARPHRPWAFRRMLPDSFDERALREWAPDGVISSLGMAKLSQGLSRLNVPVVGIADLLEHVEAGFDKVCPDDEEVGRMAADYFCQNGFTSFGFVGARGFVFSEIRRRAFEQELSRRGYALATTTLRPGGPWGRYIGPQSERTLVRWLAELPRPLAIFAANDELSLPVNEACRRLELRIPEDVALLGVDNDALLCELSWPPLSSIVLPTRRIGFEVASLLEARMNGDTTQPGPIRRSLPPVRIQVRQSSDILAIDDADLAAAIRFIRDHAAEPIGIPDILREIPISRRSLERRFQQVLRRSPLEEIQRVRVDRAKQVLHGTDLPMPEVALRSGLGDNKQLTTVFRNLTGMTPTAWRRRARARNK